MYYIHPDHLGSINFVTNASGNTVQELSFDAWGRQRNATNWTYNSLPALKFERGYTFHEHLTEFDLINMNGRVYDPVLARFLSPDPMTQNPQNLQNYNRYAYCLNNPLMYTDPDGEFIFTALCLFVPGLQPFLPLGIAADVGMYAGGAIQQGNANPLKWDYSDGDLYKSMTVGAIAGAGAMAGLGYLSGAAYTGAAGWGMISNSLLYANANMLSSVIGDYKNTGEFSLDNTFNAGISGLLYGGLGAGEPMKLWELVVANNVNDNLDILNGEAARLHIGPIGYDFGRNTNGFYSIFDKGSEGQRFDMLMETVWGLSLVPDFEVGYDGYVKKPTLNNMRDCYGRFKSPSEWTYRAKKWFDVSYSIPYGGQSSMQGFRDWLKYFYDIYKYN